jgi:formylglycine-generating enzyme required for sulfatase activity
LQGEKKSDKYAMLRTKLAHRVTIDSFFIDLTKVTNKQFTAFTKATNYETVAERKID